jgi:hypothetical protein
LSVPTCRNAIPLFSAGSPGGSSTIRQHQSDRVRTAAHLHCPHRGRGCQRTRDRPRGLHCMAREIVKNGWIDKWYIDNLCRFTTGTEGAGFQVRRSSWSSLRRRLWRKLTRCPRQHQRSRPIVRDSGPHPELVDHGSEPAD